MSARAVSGDLSVFTIGGASQLLFVKDASITIETLDAEASPITRVYESAQATGSSGRVKASLMSAVSAPTKVNNLDVSAFSVGGTSYLGNLKSGSLSIEWQHEEGKGIATRWAFPNCVKKKISMDADLKIPTASGDGLMTVIGGAVSGLDVSASITINSITTTFGGLLKSVEHTFPDGGTQMHKVQILGKGTDSGTYPAAPTGTTSILEIFLNTLAGVSFALTSKAAGGTTFSGNMLPLSYNLKWDEGAIIMADVEFATQGTVTFGTS